MDRYDNDEYDREHSKPLEDAILKKYNWLCNNLQTFETSLHHNFDNRKSCIKYVINGYSGNTIDDAIILAMKMDTK